MGPGGGGFPEIKTPPPVSILPPVITTCACALKAQSGVGTLPPVGQVAQEDFLAQEAFGFSELGPIGPSSIGPSFCHFLVPILGFRLVSFRISAPEETKGPTACQESKLPLYYVRDKQITLYAWKFKTDHYYLIIKIGLEFPSVQTEPYFPPQPKLE